METILIMSHEGTIIQKEGFGYKSYKYVCFHCVMPQIKYWGTHMETDVYALFQALFECLSIWVKKEIKKHQFK